MQHCNPAAEDCRDPRKEEDRYRRTLRPHPCRCRHGLAGRWRQAQVRALNHDNHKAAQGWLTFARYPPPRFCCASVFLFPAPAQRTLTTGRSPSASAALTTYPSTFASTKRLPCSTTPLPPRNTTSLPSPTPWNWCSPKTARSTKHITTHIHSSSKSEQNLRWRKTYSSRPSCACNGPSCS